MSGDDQQSWGIVMPFWIDTEAYTDRDREMFACGVEFQMVYDAAKNGLGWHQCIHKENESRIRMMLGKLGVKHTMVSQCNEWTDLSFPEVRA